MCILDLKNASRTDYLNACADLAALGLHRTVVASNGNNVVAPIITMGEFTGESAANVRDHVRNQVKSAFARRRFTSETSVTVGGDWTWGAATT